jgi:micrococcal nuclease
MVKPRRSLYPFLFLSLVFLLIVSISINLVFLEQSSRGSVVSKVYDGDSLELADGKRVRLLGIDAPEEGRCGYEEAKAALTRLASGKRVKLDTVIVDDYGRLVANVMVVDWRDSTLRSLKNFSRFFGVTPVDVDPLLNRNMVALGLAKHLSVTSPYKESMKAVSDVAKDRGLGIYSPQCQSSSPQSNCTIKGNIRQGQKTYYPKGCKTYDQVVVDLSFGDLWFCSETKAIDSGFTLSKTCQ